MKTFSVAVAVAVVLTFICIQESSAVPVAEVQELEEPLSMGQQEMAVESWKMPYYSRQRRHSDPRGCRFCCNCCPGMRGCGVCCKF